MPSWYSQKGVIDVTPRREIPEPTAAPTMYVHPVVLQLESALASDSLRTLCKVLAKASGTIAPAPDDPDRTRKPIMDASLTVRAFLRFLELRHGSSDDLSTRDFAGKCGSGVKVLLRKCREYSAEVFGALQTRVDDVVRMIRAFYDLTAILNRNLTFFRMVIEASIHAVLARRREPLPRLISFLEPYGEIQLTFLYEAALDGALSARLEDLDVSQLLETTESWMRRARGGQLAIIACNKVRALVRAVSLLDLELPPEQRTEWAAAAIWAATPEMPVPMQRLEVRVREGLVERGDPGEVFSLGALLAVDMPEEAQPNQLYELVAKLLRRAFARADPERAASVLREVESRTARPYPEALLKALGDICERFAAEASPERLEGLLEVWVRRKFVLAEPPRAMVGPLLERGMAGLPPGPTARSGAYLSGLGVGDKVLAPLLEKVLDEPPGWALESLKPRGRKDGGVGRALALLGRELWPRAGAPPPRLAGAEAALRLVGQARAPARAADVAAETLVSTLAQQLPGRVGQVEAAVSAWRQDAKEGRRLAAVVAPLVLEEARAGTAAEPDEGAGILTRSAALLARALRSESLGLRSAEWALTPFAGADRADAGVALTAVAAACGAAGASVPVVEAAGRGWLGAGSPPAGLGLRIIKQALVAWEAEGTRGSGLQTLRQVHAWLSSENAKLTAQSKLEPDEVTKGLDNVATLLKAVDGEPPTMADLRRAREGVLSKLGPAGQAALIDAVAIAWSAALPGVTPGSASSHFQLWWRGMQDRRSMVENLVGAALDELKWQGRLRLQATFGEVLPMGMQGPPAWRVEGRRRVPWFVPEDLVEEAYGPDGDARFDETGRSQSEKGQFVKNVTTIQKAKGITGGVCMYCGSGANDLNARLVFPLELGGQNFDSNLAAVCPLCQDFLIRLGPRKWGHALLEKPEQAAQVWWEAQKKANMKTISFLANSSEVPDLAPRAE